MSVYNTNCFFFADSIPTHTVHLVALDLDRTLIKKNISFLFGYELYNKNILRSWQVLICSFLWICHKIGIISSFFLHTVIFKILFLKKQKKCIEDAVTQFFNSTDIAHLIRDSIVQEIEYIKAHTSDRVVISLLSTSPDFLVKKFSQLIQADIWCATEYMTNECSEYYRIASIVTGKKKRDIINSIKSQLHQSGCTQIITYAYSDSIHDLPLLVESDYAICVAPDSILKMVAILKRWKIIRT